MVNFLIINKKLISYEKKDIDQGNTPPKIYDICSCIREAFCLSYAIRKSNNLYFYFIDDHILIKFIGSEIRYLGSDERSQALLLNKAIHKFYSKKNLEWNESTPGIYVKYVENLESVLKNVDYTQKKKLNWVLISQKININRNFITLDEAPSKNKNIELLFIIPLLSMEKEFLNSLGLSTSSLKNSINVLNVQNLEKPQDIILYINFYLDSLELSEKKYDSL